MTANPALVDKVQQAIEFVDQNIANPNHRAMARAAVWAVIEWIKEGK